MSNIKQLGLIGFPLSHSFSKKYFGQKFEKKNILTWQYDLFPLENIQELPALFESRNNLVGINVTIPYKEQIIPYLDELDTAASEIGAVNTVKIVDGKRIGYNTDVYGFEKSLCDFMKASANTAVKNALVLGTGGAAKAVVYVLKKLGIKAQMVSRSKKNEVLSYSDLSTTTLNDFQLIINTTPLGMSPNIDAAPNIPYSQLTSAHLCYDLVYNPKKTVFLALGEKKGCPIKNGLEMLQLQAEKAWEIWNELT